MCGGKLNTSKCSVEVECEYCGTHQKVAKRNCANADQILIMINDACHETLKDDSIKLRADMYISDIKDMDSLDYVEFIMELESKFGVEITPDESQSFKKIGDIISFIQSKFC